MFCVSMLHRIKEIVSSLHVYSLLAVVAGIAVWSLVLPLWGEITYAEPAVSFDGSAATLDASVQTTTKIRMVEQDGTFYVAYTDHDDNEQVSVIQDQLLCIM